MMYTGKLRAAPMTAYALCHSWGCAKPPTGSGWCSSCHKSANTRPTVARPTDQIYGAIRVWRLWRNNNDSLGSLVANYVWRPGINEAKSAGYGYYETYGFYGFSSLHELTHQEPMNTLRVVGSILCFGRVVVADHGVRAQYAVPEYLIRETAPGKVGIRFADKYGMRLISLEEADKLKTGVVPWWRGKKP